MPANTNQSKNEARTAPTKEFFVEMLTRDIELQDAVLDLLDNCLDGVLRQPKSKGSVTAPYKDYWTNVTMTKDKFVIEDNCGGIPREIAVRYAFAMGRPSDAPTTLQGTIGRYGIGMKRAIFRMGRRATVETKYGRRKSDSYAVEFTPNWMNDDNWTPLPINDQPIDSIKQPGTRITITNLLSEISGYFDDEGWINEFKGVVSEHYALIIEKGFNVRINETDRSSDSLIATTPIRYLYNKPLSTKKSQIQPWICTGNLNDRVNVEIYAGLYRRLPTNDELEAEEESRNISDEAGWTIACNDRVVVWKDKSRLTGWGVQTVPNFHTQFISISGIALLSAEDAGDLPLTTTKRGIDTSTEIYDVVRELMMSATKEFTNFTNRWKNALQQRDELYRRSDMINLSHLRRISQRPSFSLRQHSKYKNLRYFKPKLPRPSQRTNRARISYEVTDGDLSTVKSFLFEGNDSVSNGNVGKRTFERVLKEATTV